MLFIRNVTNHAAELKVEDTLDFDNCDLTPQMKQVTALLEDVHVHARKLRGGNSPTLSETSMCSGSFES